MHACVRVHIHIIMYYHYIIVMRKSGIDHNIHKIYVPTIIIIQLITVQLSSIHRAVDLYLPAVTSTVATVILAFIVITVAVLLLCIHRAVEPKDQSHNQTSNHKCSNNGGNIQVGSNHSLPFGSLDCSNYSILLTLDIYI